MTTLKQFCSEFDVLYLREDSPCVEGVQHFISSETRFPRDFGKSACFRALEKTMWKQGMLGKEVRDLLIRLADSIIWGKVN